MKVIPAIEDFMVKELFRHEAIRKVPLAVGRHVVLPMSCAGGV